VKLDEAGRQEIARLFREEKLSGNQIAKQLGISRRATQDYIKQLKQGHPQSQRPRPTPGSDPTPTAPLSKPTPVAIVIDNEFRGLIPPLTTEERAQLEENLLAEGCRDPLVVWAGTNCPRVCEACQAEGKTVDLRRVDWEAEEKRWHEDYGCLLFECPECDRQMKHPWTVLDGHTRREICQAYNLAFAVVEAPAWVKTREDALIWIIQHQLGRRNLEDYQRGELVLTLEPLLKAQAEARMRAGTAIDPTAKLPQGETRAQLARMAGVSARTMGKIQVIAREVDEPTKNDLRQGKRSIHHVYQTLRPRRAAPHRRPVPETSATTPGASTAMALGPRVRMAQRLIELADAILHELATWRQEFPQDLSIHAFSLMEQHLRELKSYFHKKHCDMRERSAAVAIPTDGDREGLRRGTPTPEGDTEGERSIQESTESVGEIGTPDQGLSQPDEPGNAANARAEGSIETGATDESPCTGTVIESYRTRQEARVAAQILREEGRTMRVMRASGDEAETQRPWQVLATPSTCPS